MSHMLRLGALMRASAVAPTMTSSSSSFFINQHSATVTSSVICRQMSITSKRKNQMKHIVNETVKRGQLESKQSTETTSNNESSSSKTNNKKKSMMLGKKSSSSSLTTTTTSDDMSSHEEQAQSIHLEDNENNTRFFESSHHQQQNYTAASAMAVLSHRNNNSSQKQSQPQQDQTNTTATNMNDSSITSQQDQDHLFNIINPSKYTNVQHFVDLLSEEEKKEIEARNNNMPIGAAATSTSSSSKVTSPRHSKFLRISVIGNPNAGKSSLLNKITHAKVSAVSPKKQTTREQLMVVHNIREAQLVFTDTPGVISPKYKRTDASVGQLADPLMREAMTSLEKADVVLMMIDATKPLDEIDHLVKAIAHHHKSMQQEWEAQQKQLEDEQNKLQSKKNKKSVKDSNTPQVQEQKPPGPKRFQCIAILNKKDLVEDEDSITDLEYALLDTKVFVDVIPMSVVKNDGVDRLKRVLFEMAYSHQWLYNVVLPQMSLKQRVAEVVREKLYQRLNKEVPYGVEIFVARVELTRPVPDGVILDVDLRVSTIGQRKIVIGALPFLHKHALNDLCALFKTNKVHLSFEVSVLPGKEGFSVLSPEEKKERQKLLSAYNRESYHQRRAVERSKKNQEEKKTKRVAEIWQTNG